MDGHIDLTAIVLLGIGAVVVYLVYKHDQQSPPGSPQGLQQANLGAAIMTGVAVVTLVITLLALGGGGNATKATTDEPSSTPSPNAPLEPGSLEPSPAGATKPAADGPTTPAGPSPR
ncbi:hypothetical protein [Streptomyces sp. NPDC055140]